MQRVNELNDNALRQSLWRERRRAEKKMNKILYNWMKKAKKGDEISVVFNIGKLDAKSGQIVCLVPKECIPEFTMMVKNMEGLDRIESKMFKLTCMEE